MGRKAKPWFRSDRGRFYCTVDGKQIALDVTDEHDTKAAELAYEQAKRKAAESKIRPGSMAELVEQYLAACTRKGITDKCVKSYRSYLKWFLAGFGNRAIEDVHPMELTEAAEERAWSSSTKHNAITAASGFIRWAGRKDFRAEAPPKESRGGDAVLSEKDYHRLLEEVKGDFKVYLQVLWNTGARPSEILGLTVETVDWENRCVRIRKHKTAKKGKQRIVRFGTEAFPLLERQKDKHKTGPLFRGMGGKPLTVKSVVTRLLRLAESTGIKTTAYCFRHTFATRLLSEGVPDTHVAAMLGHSGTRMVHLNYSHVSENGRLLQEIADKHG